MPALAAVYDGLSGAGQSHVRAVMACFTAPGSEAHSVAEFLAGPRRAARSEHIA